MKKSLYLNPILLLLLFCCRYLFLSLDLLQRLCYCLAVVQNTPYHFDTLGVSFMLFSDFT